MVKHSKQFSFLFIVIMTFTTMSMTAQVPGYAGKKLILTTNVDASIAFYNRLRLDYLDASNPVGTRFGLNKRFGLGLEYIVGKQLTIGASVKHANILYPWIYISNSFKIDTWTSIDSAYFGDIIVSTNYLNFYIKKFNFYDKGHIAPIGNYHKFGFSVMKANGKTGPEYETNYEAFESVSLHEDVQPVISFDQLGFTDEVVVGLISYGFGGQTIIFDRIILGCEMEFSLPVTGNVYAEDGRLELNYNQPELLNAMARRMATASWLIVNFQIGLVTF